jgi:cellulose biosynthesis protein BcsQ
MKILATYNIKGGVGKTATAVNMGFLSARMGARTLIWDLDPQGAASFYFRIRAKIKGGGKQLIRGKRDLDSLIRGTDFDLLDLLPADFSYRNLDLFLDHEKKPNKRLRRLLKPLAEDYDYMFIDCAPSISLVSESVFTAADALLVPTVPTTLSLRTLKQLRKHLDGIARPPKIFPFLCMVDRRRALHRVTSERALEDAYFLRTQIPYSSTVEKMGLNREPLGEFAAKSLPARAYESLWHEVRMRLNAGDDGFGEMMKGSEGPTL